jgi:hypothetical protein
MAVLSLPVHVCERQLTGKLALKSPEPGAVPDPKLPFSASSKVLVDGLNRLVMLIF